MVMRVVGILGESGSGKSTLAAIIAARHGYHDVAIGERLYKEVALAFDVPIGILHYRETKEQPCDLLTPIRCRDRQAAAIFARLSAREIDVGKGDMGLCRDSLVYSDARSWFTPLSPRRVLQWWGTEYRRAQDSDYWLRPIRTRIVDNPGLWVISDPRDLTDIALVRAFSGILVRIKNERGAPVADHLSESGWRAEPCEFHIDNNAGLDWLEAEADRVVGAVNPLTLSSCPQSIKMSTGRSKAAGYRRSP
jgi:hypothetical protein